jgi:hypothetical protein
VALLAAVVLATMTGCGSTVQMRSTGDALSGPSELGAGLGSGGPDGGDVTQGGGEPGSSPNSTTRGAGAGGGSSARGPAVRSGSGSAGSRTFTVGLGYSSDAEAALRAIGASNTLGDVKAAGDAVVRYINGHGGIAGARLVPAWYDASATDSPAAIAEQQCTYWTQDRHIDAAVAGGSVVDMNVLRTCLGKVGVPAVSVQYHVQTLAADLAASDLWVEPYALPLEGLAELYVDGLFRQGYFNGAKLGLLYDDGSEWASTVARVLKPALARRGVTLASEATMRIRGAGDVSSGSASLSGAILKFRSAGVTHVMFFEPWDGYAFFMQQARSQHWYPKYGLTTQTAFQPAFETGIIPADQLAEAILIGWSPVLDTVSLDPQWPRLSLCQRIFKDANLQMDGRLALTVALAGCDGLLVLADLALQSKDTLSRHNFGPALAGLGDRLQVSLMPRARIGATRRYGITEYRPALWNGSCRCFTYSGAAQPIPYS